MKFTRLLAASVAALVVTSPALAENVLRWTSQGDALTIDPHSQNEGPTIAMNNSLLRCRDRTFSAGASGLPSSFLGLATALAILGTLRLVEKKEIATDNQIWKLITT